MHLKSDLKPNITYLLDHLFSNYKHQSVDQLNNFTSSEYSFGFARIMHDKLSKVGCALSQYKLKEHANTHLSCIFSHYTQNLSTIYTVGPPCRNNTAECSTQFPGLVVNVSNKDKIIDTLKQPNNNGLIELTANVVHKTDRTPSIPLVPENGNKTEVPISKSNIDQSKSIILNINYFTPQAPVDQQPNSLPLNTNSSDYVTKKALSQLIFDMMRMLSTTTTKEEQFQVMANLTSNYLYNTA